MSFFLVAPIPVITIYSDPEDGPIAGMPYTLTCSVQSSVNGSLSPVWRDSDNLLVKSGGNLLVGDVIESGLQSNISLLFDKVQPKDEDTYVCSFSLTMDEYLHVFTDSSSVDLIAPSMLSIIINEGLRSTVG